MSSEDETSGTPGVVPAREPEAGAETGHGASNDGATAGEQALDVHAAQAPSEGLPEAEPIGAAAYTEQANLVTAPASTLTIREAGELPFGEPLPSSEVLANAPPPSTVTRPTFVFLGVVSALTLAADIGSKAWAEVALNRRGFEPIELIGKNLSVTLAYNKGGAWGMFQDAGEMVRKPFFICVSLAAIWFIVSLYARLHKSQKALTWGLPLVLGGALGNLSDRITRSQVIDFIDYQADWVMQLNAWIRSYYEGWTVTDHWPTFNVADIAICVGVGLMGVDMYTSRRRHKSDGVSVPPPPAPPTTSEEAPSSDAPTNPVSTNLASTSEIAQTIDSASVSA